MDLVENKKNIFFGKIIVLVTPLSYRKKSNLVIGRLKMKNFKNTLITTNKNLGSFFQLIALVIFGIMSCFSGQAIAQQQCTPSTTILEGDTIPGGYLYFRVNYAPGTVTVRHIEVGSGLMTLTLVNSSNASVNIGKFEPETFEPVEVDFKPYYPNLKIDFTLRAANSLSSIFIRVRCDSVPPLIITEDPSMFPGGIEAFESISAERDSITVDPSNSGSGLQSFSVVSATNAVITIPEFTPNTPQPTTANFIIIDRSQPVEFTLRATDKYHGVLIKALIGACGRYLITDESSPGSTEHFAVTPPENVTTSGTLSIQTVDDLTGLQSLTVVSSSNAVVNIPEFKEGTLDPVVVNFTKVRTGMPSCMILQATSHLHSVYIVLCSC